jgi:murein DD-endopeptidase MepM/ murein hydrolase activator NlpD
MSFVMIAAGRASSSRVRTLPLRTLLGASALAAAGLLATGGAVGYWLAQSAAPSAAPEIASPSAQSFSVEQLGALSGRLFTLENQAGQLSRRIGQLQGASPRPGAASAPAAASAARGARADAGGPMLPPRPEPQGLDALRARLLSLEDQIGRVAEAASEHNLALMRLPTRPPLRDAELVSHFGNRDDPLTGRRAFHGGLDFAATTGTPIHAAAGGTVVFAGFKADFGKTVEIDHGNGLVTRYAHASALWVKAGELVAPGHAIAAVGSTGRSTGAHLHFEVLRHGEAVNPRRYLAGL